MGGGEGTNKRVIKSQQICAQGLDKPKACMFLPLSSYIIAKLKKKQQFCYARKLPQPYVKGTKDEAISTSDVDF